MRPFKKPKVVEAGVYLGETIIRNQMIKEIEDVVKNIFKELGAGHNESIYHKAFELELSKRKIEFQSFVALPIFYNDFYVGTAEADIIIGNKVVIELKTVSKLNGLYEVQLKKYMECLGIKHGVLINFPSDGEPEVQVF